MKEYHEGETVFTWPVTLLGLIGYLLMIFVVCIPFIS